ncbi:tyrosine-type recombinase/integrase [Anaeroselena agilis]|uniref:Tyrosine-type recombinase/integrase n=1 Tax=Anaeroselena agilis TaxID=3063788 RepID=A0ABU3P4I8_9FIRM|nr:tyrosine-type recombinase/integrase [Selenomonadales bacterium 4137-cl]
MKGKGKKYGEGHVDWRKSSARVIFYHKGERFVLPLGVVSEKEADLARLQFILDVKSGKVLPRAAQKEIDSKEMTFAHYTAVWLEDRKPLASAKTFHEDKRRIESRILPVFGAKKLAAITGFELDQYVKGLLARPWKNGDKTFKPLSDQSRKHYFRLLFSMFEQACAWGFIPTNPMKGLKAPSATNKKTAFYSISDLADFWRVFPDSQLQRALLIHIAWTLGLRREELSGLRWSDIDFDSLTATVQNCRIYIPGQGVLDKGPKNGKPRSVGVTPQVLEVLTLYKAEYDNAKVAWKKQWLGKDLVFVKLEEKGAPYNPSTIDHWLDEYLEDNGLPHITLHGFRHTMGSLLHEAGMNTVTISELLGHSTKQAEFLGGYESAPRVTRTYLHGSKDATTKMTGLMSEIFDQVMLLKAQSSQTSSQDTPQEA